MAEPRLLAGLKRLASGRPKVGTGSEGSVPAGGQIGWLCGRLGSDPEDHSRVKREANRSSED